MFGIVGLLYNMKYKLNAFVLLLSLISSVRINPYFMFVDYA